MIQFSADATLQDVIDSCDTLPTYQSTRQARLTSCIRGDTEQVDNAQLTLGEIAEKVKLGLAEANRAAQSNPSLLVVVERLQTMWNELVTQLMLVSVGVHSFTFQNDEMIRAQLVHYQSRLMGPWVVDGVEGNA